MKGKRFLATWGIVALVGLLVGLGGGAVQGGGDDLPAINYLRIDIDHLDRWVVHWAGEVDPEAEGTFALSGSSGGPFNDPVCTGIGDDTACNCRWDPYGPDFWAGCVFDAPDPFNMPAYPGRCMAHLWWLPGNGMAYQVKTYIGPCWHQVFVPMVAKVAR